VIGRPACMMGRPAVSRRARGFGPQGQNRQSNTPGGCSRAACQIPTKTERKVLHGFRAALLLPLTSYRCRSRGLSIITIVLLHL
jgi:hypothetical protein